MSQFVRASKFRHVFCDNPKPQQTFMDLRLSTVAGEHNFIKSNPLFIAVGIAGGGGPLAILKTDKPGRVDPAIPSFAGHHGSLLDFDFNPFNDHIIASGSEDMSVKVWEIPEGGLKTTVTTPVVDFGTTAHQKKVSFVKFHPTVNNMLGSAAADGVVKLWDIEKGSSVTEKSHSDNLINDLVWDYTGSQYAVSCKDKVVTIIDARTTEAIHKLSPYEGSKSTKLCFVGHDNKLLTVGFNKQSIRQLKIFDPKSGYKELCNIDLDQAAGAMMIFYDRDANMLYLSGKGDGKVSYYEVLDQAPYVYPLSEYRSNVPSKGIAMMPKRGVNAMGCEIERFYKLTGNSIEPLSFVVPRKSEIFQEDLYPDTASTQPSHSVDEWLAGSELPPVLCSMNPQAKSSEAAASHNSSSVSSTDNTKRVTSVKTMASLTSELQAANIRIKQLEERLAAAGLSTE